MLNIDEELLFRRVVNHRTYLKGKQYYEEGRVKEVSVNKRDRYFEAEVVGSRKYKTSVQFDQNGNLAFTNCTCPAYAKYPLDCKHIIALLSYIENLDLNKIFSEDTDEEDIKDIEDIIDFYRYVNYRDETEVNIEFNYEYDLNTYDGIPKSSFLSLRIGEDKLYVVKSIKKFFEYLENGQEIVFGKGFTFLPHKHIFKPEDKEIMDFLRLIYENESLNSFSYNSYGRESSFKGKRLLLTTSGVKRFFEFMKERTFNVEIMGEKYKNISITEESIPLNIRLEKLKKGLQLKVDKNNELFPLTVDGEYFFYDEKIYKLPKEKKIKILPIYNKIINRDGSLKVPDKYKEAFISEVLPNIKTVSNIDIDEKVKESVYSPEFKCEIYLDKNNDIVTGKVNFIYGDININPFSGKNDDLKRKERILLRDTEGEMNILKLLEESEFKVKDGEIYISKEEKIFDFICCVIPKLQNFCIIYYSENFKNITFKDSSHFSGGIRLDEKTSMLEFDFDIEGIDKSELENVFMSLKEKKKYYKLKDGSFLPLNDENLNNISGMLDYLDVTKRDFKKGIMSIPKFRAAYLDNYLKEKNLNFVKKNIKFKKLVQDINEPEDISYEIPQEVRPILRDYQKIGFKWLKTLYRYGLGGILADDMGLGKTLQVIAFLLSEKEENGQDSSLVVAPTSLLYNWEEEVQKFAPSLKALVIAGSKDERKEMFKDIGGYDIVITSYPLIRRDIEFYENTTFRCCILDEAQYIKNSNSLNAKSVKSIKAQNYFALTGTPMENSIIELWSIFDFIMPGYLLSNRKFVQRYEKPIVKNGDNKALKDLNSHIKPFILRRLKKDVLKELPEKIEQKVVSELTKEQKKLYLSYLKGIKGEIEKEINEKGFGRSHIKILAGLTRLRQICCHPAMFVEDYEGESGKLALLEEILKDAIDGGHRVLIFSQFTSMLTIIRRMIEDNDIEYMYLDGSTNVAERGRLVKQFNKGKGKVFLISLKAGGTGLNLTGADMVIHFDPWWNPAVEDQATDRTYRIGQKKSVQVIKMISKGTIEEKIFKLQERKKEMIDKVITEGETLVSSLSEEDVKYLFEA